MAGVPMKLYFAGGEVPSHRKILAANNVTHVSLSYFGLKRRLTLKNPWLVDEKFPAWQHVMVDSGAHSVNKHAADYEGHEDELMESAAGYQDFIAANIDRIDSFTEFDALPLGLDWLQGQREKYAVAARDKLIVVWHAEYGLAALEQLAQRHKRIAILQTSLGERDLMPQLNLLASRGTLFHGLAMTKPEIMREVRWDSVGSTSWISPMQFGDTQIWDNNQMRRYPKKYKEESRREHRALFARNGFNADLIMADDTAEVARLTLWSWQQLIEHMARVQSPVSDDLSAMEVAPVSVLESVSVAPRAVQAPSSRERVLLPGISMTEPADGGNPQLEISGDSLRRCDTCFLRDRGCPRYEPGAECAYKMPVMIRTPSDVRALENALIDMQTQRVTFMRFVEDIEGGFPDPNLSTELDRLTRMIKLQREGSADKFSLSINASRQPGESGIIGSMFGTNVADAQTIKTPAAADELIKASVMADAYQVTEK